MKVCVNRCSNPSFWYYDNVGSVYRVICYYAEDKVFLVRDNEGYLNIINKDDAVVVKEDNEF